MQKIRLQIMLSFEDVNLLHHFESANQLRNESIAISELLRAHNRFQFVINELEKRAHEAEKWKLQAEKQAGTVTKPTIVKGVKKNTVLKAKSGEYTLNTQKPLEDA